MSKSRKMIKDSEDLFELCKQVYEATGWDKNETDDGFYWNQRYIYENYPSKGECGTVSRDDASAWHQHSKYVAAPLYTSDYLLEKLQSWFYDMGANDFGQFGVTMLADSFIASVRSHDKEFSEQASGDTLLLALLKLTLKLHEEGLL